MRNSFIKILVLFTIFIIANSCVEDHVMPKIGTVFITSDPIGAKIFLDDEDQNMQTPDSLNNLLEGEYKITLKLNEFNDTTFNINVKNHSNISENIYLNESNPKGKIILNSSPSGAQIYLDGINTGKTTPDTLKNLRRGSYNIKLKLSLYDDSDFQVELNKDQTISKNTQMLVAGTSSSLAITSNPSGATITINDEAINKATPYTLKPISSGTYKIKLSLVNYRDTTVTVSVSSGEAKTANINLTLYEPRGSISLTSNPTNAAIFIDGTNTNLFTPNKLSKLEAGQYEITLKYLGYYDTTFTVNVNRDQNTTVPIVNMQFLPEIGDFKINSDPVGAEIYVDGLSTGFSTPHTFVTLLVKEYSVTLKLKDFADTTINFDLIKDNVVDLGTVYLRDIVPAVDVIIDYKINSNQQLVFSFIFNQDIKLTSISAADPNGTTWPQSFNELVPKGRVKDIIYPEKINGKWKFTISGNKTGGRKADFEISEEVTVQ